METGSTPSTEELLQQILAEQQQHRQEVANLRDELAQAKAQSTPAPAPSRNALSAEELQSQRMEEVDQHDFYCPGCGKLVDYQQQCHGRPEAPHQPVEVVSTDELKAGDPSKHTAAPNTDKLG